MSRSWLRSLDPPTYAHPILLGSMKAHCYALQSGKSSFINSLARKQVLPVYKLSSSNDGPTTTILPQEVSLEAGGKKIRLIDTPGLSWAALDEQSAEDVAHTRARDILTRNKGRIDRLKDPEPVGTSDS